MERAVAAKRGSRDSILSRRVMQTGGYLLPQQCDASLFYERYRSIEMLFV
jgi:hypothetical protein